VVVVVVGIPVVVVSGGAVVVTVVVVSVGAVVVSEVSMVVVGACVVGSVVSRPPNRSHPASVNVSNNIMMRINIFRRICIPPLGYAFLF
jgi:hypothetical protein